MFRVLFGVSLIGLALAVLMAIPADTPMSPTARLLVPVLALLCVVFFVLSRRTHQTPQDPASELSHDQENDVTPPGKPLSKDMNHLLKDGWMAFLEQMPGPDPFLWHDIATDFHDIESPASAEYNDKAHIGIDPGGRLDAAFWILAQAECDRATASDFIRGFVAYELLENAAQSGNEARLAAFASVIDRYNAGFYQTFAIRPDIRGIEPVSGPLLDGEFDEAALINMIQDVENTYSIDPLPRPKGLLSYSDEPNAPNPQTYNSRLRYDNQSGVGLEAI